MNNNEAYNDWAASYDEVANATRDLEMHAKKIILQDFPFSNVLELGCGTGKNTSWLINQCNSITAVDFSENMIAMARQKLNDDRVNFVSADINQPWHFVQQSFDLITCSLVLEHIENLAPVFEKASDSLMSGGYFYIGELHPFKQYSGSKARFHNADATIVLDCFTHHISEYTNLATKNNLALVKLEEWFDDDAQVEIPRIVTFLFKKT